MTKYNETNERLKRDYCQLLQHSQGKSEATLDGVRKALQRYEEYTGQKDFASFNREQAIAFKRDLAKQQNQRTGKPLSKATILTTLNILRSFFEWLYMQPGYRSKIDLSSISYLNMTETDKRAAGGSRGH